MYHYTPIKHWPFNPVVQGSRPSGGGNRFNRKQDSTAHSLSLLPTYGPDMTEIL